MQVPVRGIMNSQVSDTQNNLLLVAILAPVIGAVQF